MKLKTPPPPPTTEYFGMKVPMPLVKPTKQEEYTTIEERILQIRNSVVAPENIDHLYRARGAISRREGDIQYLLSILDLQKPYINKLEELNTVLLDNLKREPL